MTDDHDDTGPTQAEREAAAIRTTVDAQTTLEREFVRWIAMLAIGSPDDRDTAEDAARSLRYDAMVSSTHAAHLMMALELFDGGVVPEFNAISGMCRQRPELLKKLGDWETIGALWLIAPMQHMSLGTDGKRPSVLGAIVEWLNRDADTRRRAEAYARARVAVERGEDPGPILDAIEDLAQDNREEEHTFARLADLAMVDVLSAANITNSPAIPTGFTALDRAIGPLKPGMTAIGGRPGDGKSTLGLAMQRRWAEMGIPSTMISVEDPRDVVSQRVAADITGIPQTLFRGTGAAPTFNQGQAFEQARKMPQWEHARVAFRVGGSLHEVLRAMNVAVRRHGARALLVDYLQTIRGDERQQRNHEIRRIAAAIKARAVKLGVPVVLFSQLSRYKTARPTLRDFRDAGEIEEMIENGILLWREDGHRYAVVGKAKSGPSGGTFELDWDDPTASIRGMRAVELGQEPQRANGGRVEFRDD